MGRLIVVSNRVSPPREEGEGTVGGLAMALAAALREHDGVWFGWSGETCESFTGRLSMERVSGVTVATVDLEEADVRDYYNGYANKTLWPLFHYRLDLMLHERAFQQAYARVNERLADTLTPLVGPEDVVWVHDYHLIPLGRALRARGLKNRIGFFLHIPWPSRRLLATLPGGRALAQSLFDYDLVGFQTDDARGAFEDYVRVELGGQVGQSDGTVRADGRVVRLGTFPIGLDTAAFTAAAASEEGVRFHERMVESAAGRRMIVGVDRLDYSKGLEDRFRAYEEFLEQNPDQHEKVFFLQIATPSRDAVEAYQEIHARLDSVSGRINGAYATVDWVPLCYVNRGYRRDELAGVYRAARVGLVTPLRDGMNLVAKEYVAAQDPEDPGVLILSRFAGAAAQMGASLIVNPFAREEVADAIARALNMPLQERKARWQELFEGVRTQDVSWWRETFVRALLQEPADAAA